jgi:hypothetical protein
VATTEAKIYYDDLIRKISDISGKAFDGRKFADIISGINRITVKKGRERLDIMDEDDLGWYYELNPKYKNIIKRYLESND